MVLINKGKFFLFLNAWLARVCIATRSLREENSGDRIPGGDENFHTRQ